jgi:Na+-transporting methylmalonyl-CoA/oxaloacetate decarboxylase gamma subunit
MGLTFMTLVFCILGLLISAIVIDVMSKYDDHKEDIDDEIPTDDLIRRETLKKGKHDTID